MRKKGDENLKAKVFELWPRIIDQIDFSNKEGRRMASKLCHWAEFVDDLDEERMGWLTTIAPFAEEEHNAYSLLESLASISKNQPFEAHTVWMKILEADVLGVFNNLCQQLL